MNRKLRLFIISLIAMLGVDSALAQVNYLDRSWDDVNKKVVTQTKTLGAGEYTALSGNHTGEWITLSNGWYVVTDYTKYQVLDVKGNDVHIVVMDDKKVEVTGGVKVESGYTLHIHGQENETGRLAAMNYDYHEAACIGGGNGAKAGNIIIHSGFVWTNGHQNTNHSDEGGGAGIGGGEDCGNDGYCGTVTIYGGTVEATGGSAGAGIGGSRGGKGANVTIYGGTVKAKGNSSSKSAGAGIGGGDGGDGGLLTIYGGDVTATGAWNSADIIFGSVYTSSPGVGGGGDNGAGGTTYVYGGTLNAIGRSRCPGIGGGYFSTGDSGIGGNTYIYGGKVIAEGGDVVKRAIGGSAGSDNYGILEIADSMMVTAGWVDYETEARTTDKFSAAERVPACFYRHIAIIEPCNHQGATFTVSGTTPTDTHTKHCYYCSKTFPTETHTFDGNYQCTVCGVKQDTYTASIYIPAQNAEEDGQYEANNILMIPGSTFMLTGASDIEDMGLGFAGWLEGTPPNNSYLADNSETLLESGTPYTINGDVTFTARYKTLHNITANQRNNGTTEVSKSSSIEGKTISVTASPAYGYVVENVLIQEVVTIAGRQGYSKMSYDTIDDLHYTFVMPDNPVLVTVSYKADESTGIDDVISTDTKGQKADNHWYTLGGSRLSDRPTQKGIYIHGGKKAVIK